MYAVDMKIERKPSWGIKRLMGGGRKTMAGCAGVSSIPKVH